MCLLIDKKANPIFRVDVLSHSTDPKFDGEDGTSTIDVWMRLYYPGNTIALTLGGTSD